MTARARLTRWLVAGVLAIIAFLALYPIFFMVIGSLKTGREFTANPLGLPVDWLNFSNYIGLGNQFDVVRLVSNTAIYIAFALVLSMLLAVPAAYAIAKLRFPGSTLLFAAIVASLGVPTISILVPDYLLFVQAGFADSPVGVIAMWTAQSLPGSIFLISAVIRALPDELIEAATIDGARYPRLMRSVVIPLAVPGIVTASIFNITGWWNDLLIPLVFFQSSEKQTLTAAIATIGQRMSVSDVPQIITALLVSSSFPILLYILLQNYIRRGLVMGSVK